MVWHVLSTAKKGEANGIRLPWYITPDYYEAVPDEGLLNLLTSPPRSPMESIASWAM